LLDAQNVFGSVFSRVGVANAHKQIKKKTTSPLNLQKVMTFAAFNNEKNTREKYHWLKFQFRLNAH
jgi:hypothetical protein